MHSSSSEKNLVKPLRITIFGSNCTKKGSLWATSKIKNNFFKEIIKPDHKLSETFYFIKISYVLTELWMFFYFKWCFFAKHGHFQPNSGVSKPIKKLVINNQVRPQSINCSVHVISHPPQFKIKTSDIFLWKNEVSITANMWLKG